MIRRVDNFFILDLMFDGMLVSFYPKDRIYVSDLEFFIG